MDEIKKKSLEEALQRIEKNYGKGSIMNMDGTNKVKVDVIPTGCLALDQALGIGGVPRGRIVEIYGPESSGKTTLALHIAAEAQKPLTRRISHVFLNLPRITVYLLLWLILLIHLIHVPQNPNFVNLPAELWQTILQDLNIRREISITFTPVRIPVREKI